MWLVRIGGENRWTLYDFGTVALRQIAHHLFIQ